MSVLKPSKHQTKNVNAENLTAVDKEQDVQSLKVAEDKRLAENIKQKHTSVKYEIKLI